MLHNTAHHSLGTGMCIQYGSTYRVTVHEQQEPALVIVGQVPYNVNLYLTCIFRQQQQQEQSLLSRQYITTVA